MLRITQLSRPDGRQVLLLEGHLVGPWVAELQRTAAEADAGTIVDLTAVAFADAGGVAALRQLRSTGTELSGASGFLAALMGADDGAGRDAG
jgi:hypothetical protein